jgi:serine/threonine protein kinase
MIASDEEAVFLEALQKTSPDSRADFLNQACGGDEIRRQSIERLLQAHERAGSFLHEPVACPGTMDQTTTERVGSQIGRYKLLEQVGEGGMGVVYVAEQTEPVRRRVALKIISRAWTPHDCPVRRTAGPAMMTIRILPSARAGTTEAGRPYFVMELVRGMPITEYCDKVRLSPRQRLELFVDVCQAVQHAHQKGIIHRDLKPSNVMVTTNDGRPVVKVIDFGVAKAVGQQLTERTVYTALTQLVGTPLYMSPEQAELTSHDVDTRSDVYSLGVLLYELLTGPAVRQEALRGWI